MLIMNNVIKKYGSIEAINIKKLEIPKGSLFAFIGKNGAGKTTTIKSIVGLLNIDAGYIKIDNKDLKKYKNEIKKEIGFIADTPMVYDYLTGYEFVKFMANIYGINDNEILEKRMESYFRRFEMEDKASDFINTYSHGTKQKVAIIATLIHNPKLLILDEPTVGLDPQTTIILKEVLLEEQEKGTTVFLSTHILPIAEEICDRVAIIDKGKIKYQGTMEEINKYYLNLEDAFVELTEK